MDNPEFVAQIRHLHEDVRYMFIRAMKLNDKSILDLEKSGDYLKHCCQKLAKALLMVTQNTAQYARELEKHIRGVALEMEYHDTLELLMLITLNKDPVKTLENGELIKSDISSEELNNSQDLFDQATVVNSPPNPNELNISDISNLPEKEGEPNKQGNDSDLEIVSWLAPNGSSIHTATNELEKHELTHSTDLSTFSQDTVICEGKNSAQESPEMFIEKKVVNVLQNGDSDATDWDGADLGKPSEEQSNNSQVFSLYQSEEGLCSDELEEESLLEQKWAFLLGLGLAPKLKSKLGAINEDSEQPSTTISLVANDNLEPLISTFSENVSRLSNSTEGSEAVQLHKKLNQQMRNSLVTVIKKYLQKRQGQAQVDSSSSDTEVGTRDIKPSKRKCKDKRKITDDAQQCISSINQNLVSSSLNLDSDIEASHLTKAKRRSKSQEDIKGGPKRLRSSSESSLDSPKVTSSAKKLRPSSENLLLDSEGRDGLVQLLDEHQHVIELRMSSDNSNDAQIGSVKPTCVPIKEPRSTDNIEDIETNYRRVKSFASPVKFQLNDSDRDELLELLTKHVEGHKSDLSSPDTSSINLEAPLPNPDKKILLDLIEEAVNKETGSDTESCLMDILREETVIEGSQYMDKRDGDETSCVHDKEAWEAFEALMAEDEDLSSSSSCSDLSEGRFWSCQSRGRHRTLTREIRKEFGIDRDLFVNIERLDNCELNMSEYRERKKSSVVENLCNLRNIFQIRKGHRASKRRNTRKRTVSLTSSSCSELNSLSDDRESTPVLMHEEDRDVPASLWDNIKNSSDEECLSGMSDKDDEKQKSEEDEVSGTTGEGSESDYRDEKTVVLDSSDEEDFVGVRKSRPAWRQDPLLNASISFSSDSETKPGKKHERKRKEVNLDESDRNRRVKKKKKQRPIRTFLVESDTTTDDSDFEIISVQRKMLTPQAVITLSDEDAPNKRTKGRRNIRALVEDEDLAEATQRANNEERERIRRLQERDKAKESFMQSFGSQENDIDIVPLILDVSEGTEIRVHPKITCKLKPHQREGIQFMWDSCYESVKQLKEDNYNGSGCILAHCMGLGKTLQALALIQAIFNSPVTKTNHVLVVCPLSTVSNWKNEFKLAYKGIKDPGVKFHSIEVTSQAQLRFDTVNKWHDHGGMLVMGYECFGLLVNEQKLMKWERNGNFQKEDILKALVDPGPDLVICDEGHLLRNQQSKRTLALSKIKTKRRIILTGTPLQNNLLEYYYMVNFVKPCLLGTEKEYKTNFVNPIHNGQYEDSTAEDIMFMKKRTHVLHKILINTVQRVEDTELKRYLPKLVDQAVFVKLSDLQVQLYNTYLDSSNSQPIVYTKKGQICRSSFLADVQMLQYICLHPNVLCTAEQKARAKATVKEQDIIDDNPVDELEESQYARFGRVKDLLSSKKTTELSTGTKLEVALGIVREAEACGEKVLIFSQSHAEMDNLEYFLQKNLNYKNKREYYRMDGTVSPTLRSHMCNKFNDPKNKSIKVFVMSKKVGGLGLNLTAANRVIIMNVGWNPSYDTQSVFRAFRFGQDKSVFVYRLIAIDTMEEKMYQRVVTKLAIAHRVVDKHQITRHYSSADIQEFYSVRPTVDEERPVPKVPEDRILAKIIQTHKHVFRWHEHQALLANRPEEDLDEQQKNAAWEEFNKVPAPESGPAGLNQCSSGSVQSNASNYQGPMLSGSSGRRGKNYHKLLPIIGKLKEDSLIHDTQKQSKSAAEVVNDTRGKQTFWEVRTPSNKVFTAPEEGERFPALPDHTYSRPNSESHSLACYPSLDDFTPPPLYRSRCQSYGHFKLLTRRPAFVNQRLPSADEFKPAPPLRNSATRYLFQEQTNKAPLIVTNTRHAPARLCVDHFVSADQPSNKERKGHSLKSPPISNKFALVPPIANKRSKVDISKAPPTTNLFKQNPRYEKEQRKAYPAKATPTTSNFVLDSSTNGRNKLDTSITPLTTNQQQQVDTDRPRPDTQSLMHKRIRNFMEHLHLLQSPENVNKDGSKVSPVQNRVNPSLKVARNLSEFKFPPAHKTTSDPASERFVRVKPFFKLASPPHSRVVKRSVNASPTVPVHEVAKASSRSVQKSTIGKTRPSRVGLLQKHLIRTQINFPLGPSTSSWPPKPMCEQLVPMSPSKSNKENKSLRNPVNLTSEETIDGPYKDHRELLDGLKKKGVSVDVARKPSPGTA